MSEVTPENNTKAAADIQEGEVTLLRRELEKEKEKADDYLNRLKCLQADFENYKKRAKKEMDETIQYGNRRLILELLTVIDELECAVAAARQLSDKTLLDGVEITLNKLRNILKKEGVSIIEATGKPFDPNRHEAVLRVQTEGEDGVILDEIRKGYMLKDIVIRPSMVKVAINTSKKGENE